MKAEVLLDERHIIVENAFVEIVIWRLPRPVRSSAHALKYRLALVVGGACVLRYDNEAGKGDHRHFGDLEMAYKFRSYDQLLVDFWTDVELWRHRR